MKIQRVNFLLSTGEDGWMRGNIDRAIVNEQIAKTVRVNKPAKAAETGLMLSTDVGLECKTANAFMADKWGPSQEDEIVSGKVVTDHQIPLYYETQIQWYMAVTGIKKFYVAVLIGGQDFRLYEVKEASNDEAADIGELRTIKEQIKELQEQEKAVASRVILAIGEKTGLTIGGQKAVTFKAQNSSRFSSTAFKKEHPDLYADFVQTTSTRILRLA